MNRDNQTKGSGRTAALLVIFMLAALPAFAGWLGIGVADITPEKVTSLKLKEERGVEIVTVSPDSPAAQAGLKAQDVVLEFNGQRVDSVEQFQRMVRETPAGRSVRVLISRDGATQSITVKPGDQPRFRMRGPAGREREFAFTVPMPRIEIPDMPDFGDVMVLARTGRLGVDAEPLTRQLGEYFGAPNGEGVLVRSVERDSAAEKAGIKAGDVIVKVGSEKVTNVRDLRNALRDRSDKAVPVTLIRNRKEMTVPVNLERRDRGGEFSPGAEKV